MNVLFLDDNPRRTEMFLAALVDSGHTIDTCETAKDCIELLQSNSYDCIRLDHDLGGEYWVESERDDCGMAVVRWIVENKPQIPKIIIHSHNVKAAKEMCRQLREAKYVTLYIPFGEEHPNYRD